MTKIAGKTVEKGPSAHKAHKPDETVWDVVVIGGGPSGMMAAGRAAEKAAAENKTGDAKPKILILEKNESLGKKLLITGGGRCNVTNAEPDTRTLLAKFKDSDQFLFSAFSQWGVAETLEFFHSRNMPTKEEAHKRVFPASNTAQSVWETLVGHLKTNGVTVMSEATVIKFNEEETGGKEKTGNRKITSVSLRGGKNGKSEIFGKSFILATGGTSRPETGSTGDGFKWLEQLGHKVSAPDMALVPVSIKDEWVKKLAGLTMSDVKITLLQNDVKQESKKGKLLFTHVGLSGPTILNMSKDIGELLKYGEVMISLDLAPSHDFSTLNTALQELFKKEHRKKIKNSFGSSEDASDVGNLIPARIVPIILERAKISPETACNSITRDQRIALMQVIKDLRMQVRGLLGVDKAVVTSGGVALSEIDFKTMQSRIISNLYVVGDMLDIDRPSGGYSLQLCWTTGWVAGNSAAIDK